MSVKKDYKYKVSVYIVNHNYGNYIEECISSVLNQTFKNYVICSFNLYTYIKLLFCLNFNKFGKKVFINKIFGG